MEKSIKLLFYFITLVYNFSCRSIKINKNYYEEIHEKFYIVDTIIISDPLRIYSPKFGGQFIISKKILKEFNNKIDFFNRPDVYLLGTDLYRDLPLSKFKNYKYHTDSKYSFVKSELNNKNIEIYELKSNNELRFILGLINSEYYVKKYNSYVSFDMFKDKNAYYKIVYPLVLPSSVSFAKPSE